ncbi:hypothetical protein HU200_018174 [Digitaria exilis]|uniref:Uncharacterized protein n=1 Tax=Digitaria exilis TaxID=1010633 RepID=A0A835KGP6_9POAL|nr:hypothetical protein HU200_018174 [Digitaria exilis]
MNVIDGLLTTWFHRLLSFSLLRGRRHQIGCWQSSSSCSLSFHVVVP